MKQIYKAVACCLLMIFLLSPSPFAAFSESAYPACQGTVTDLANVLGEDTIRDLTELSARTGKAIGGKIYVVTRHFLGGEDAKKYADGLFAAWELGEKDALLLLVIGEENYALALGGEIKGKIPADNQTGLLGTHLRSAYLNREYDRAAADFFLNYVQAAGKAYGRTVSVSGLLGEAALQSTPAPVSLSQVLGSMFGKESPDEIEQHEKDDEDSVNWKGIIIWGLVIYFLFFRKRKKPRYGFFSRFNQDPGRNQRKW